MVTTEIEYDTFRREAIIKEWMVARMLYGTPFGLIGWHPNTGVSFTFMDGYQIRWGGTSNAQ